MEIARGKELAQAEETGTDVPVVDERGNVQKQEDGTPHTITVVGSLSKRYQTIKAKNRGRALNGATAKTLTDEEAGQQSFNQQTESVAECVVRWTAGAFTENGQPLEPSVANAIKVFRAFPWMQGKCETAMDDHARFFGASSNGSNG